MFLFSWENLQALFVFVRLCRASSGCSCICVCTPVFYVTAVAKSICICVGTCVFCVNAVLQSISWLYLYLCLYLCILCYCSCAEHLLADSRDGCAHTQFAHTGSIAALNTKHTCIYAVHCTHWPNPIPHKHKAYLYLSHSGGWYCTCQRVEVFRPMDNTLCSDFAVNGFNQYSCLIIIEMGSSDKMYLYSYLVELRRFASFWMKLHSRVGEREVTLSE